MAHSLDGNDQQITSPNFWKTETLREYLRKHGLLLGGNKSDLVIKVEDFMKTKLLEHELDVVAFEQLDVEEAASFGELSDSKWISLSFPPVTEEAVGMYLKRLGACTKNYRTGVRLYQCGHVYDVQCSTKG